MNRKHIWKPVFEWDLKGEWSIMYCERCRIYGTKNSPEGPYILPYNVLPKINFLMVTKK